MRRINPRGRRIAYFEAIPGHPDHIVSRSPVSQGIPDRTCRDQTDTVDGDIILLMRVAGKDRAYPLLLEQGKY